jgi:hypothetical protein
MTNFTVTGNWASQGTVNGTVSFTPLPSTAGVPVSATISASTLSTTLTVISGSYVVSFAGVTLNGVTGTIESFVFTSPQSAVTVNLNSIVAPVPNVVTQSTVPLASSGPLSYASNATAGPVVLSNSTVASSVVSLTVAAGQLAIGSTFRTTLRGTIQTQTTSGILTFTPFVGPNASTATFVMPTQAANATAPFFLQYDTTVQQVGASGAFVAAGFGRIEFATAVPLTSTTTSTAVVDTTQPSFNLQTQAQWATASATNTLTVVTAAIERVV